MFNITHNIVYKFADSISGDSMWLADTNTRIVCWNALYKGTTVYKLYQKYGTLFFNTKSVRII